MSTNLVVEPLDRRPELSAVADKLEHLWPTFMEKDPMGSLYYTDVERNHPQHVLVAYEPPDVPVAVAYTVPFEFGSGRRTELPDDGWDAVIRWATQDRDRGTEPNLVSALEIAIRPDRRGEGLATVMLAAMRDNVRRLGFTELVAPVRPSAKHQEPHVPIGEYAHRTRPDGLPADPWLRVHARAGAEIVKVAPRSMVITGTLADWRSWTGLPFDTSGEVVVPGALVPVLASVEHDHAVYVEPNVWMRHPIDPSA
ncbi:N-acetyltransferase [Jiangella asiatica]|uniref:N-acetyltransferase n=1 Tax=Jiangella asiatica TaxID=2530372 RepID=A0A4R5CND0_9ACTN|nr:N-acetyltransferase [Jiangella asiatica]TDD99084.1 N-acetyltransferase [Jiangella asiatica]